MTENQDLKRLLELYCIRERRFGEKDFWTQKVEKEYQQLKEKIEKALEKARKYKPRR